VERLEGFGPTPLARHGLTRARCEYSAKRAGFGLWPQLSVRLPRDVKAWGGVHSLRSCLVRSRTLPTACPVTWLRVVRGSAPWPLCRAELASGRLIHFAGVSRRGRCIGAFALFVPPRHPCPGSRRTSGATGGSSRALHPAEPEAGRASTRRREAEWRCVSTDHRKLSGWLSISAFAALFRAQKSIVVHPEGPRRLRGRR
jgi:hypothetical protein